MSGARTVVRRAEGLCLALLTAAGGLVLSGCATPGSTAADRSHAAATAGPHHRAGRPAPPATGTGPAATPTTATTTTTTTTTTVPPQAGWTVLATEPTGVAVDSRTLTEADGTTVRVLRFRSGQVRFDLHVGTSDPPTGSVVLPPSASPQIGPTESSSILAAFNAGFKVTAHAGGVEVDGHVLTPLENGMASLVIDASGRASIGVWGTAGFAAVAGQAVSVRQNLPPLVVAGAPSPAASTWPSWGATLGGGPYVARSALGEDAAGDLIYAASMSTLPVDLADALVSSGAVIGMELDINPEWVQADVAPTPGAALVAAVPGQNRPADQYMVGWTRDFIAVLAR